jgi:hypothetical protein
MPWPVSESYVADCESAMGVNLPDTYRIAMMNQNGGSIICDHDTWTLHPIWDKSEKNGSREPPTTLCARQRRWPVGPVGQTMLSVSRATELAMH